MRSGEDLAFLPFDRQDRRLDVSRFDVGGDTTRGRERELSAYLFSDRGLYRPGEAFHAGLIVRPTVWGQDLSGVPLEISVLDPRGLEVKKVKLALSAAGFESIDYQTQENGLTGSFTVCVYIVKDGRRAGLLGSTTVRVEEFLPAARARAIIHGAIEPEQIDRLRESLVARLTSCLIRPQGMRRIRTVVEFRA